MGWGNSPLKRITISDCDKRDREIRACHQAALNAFLENETLAGDLAKLNFLIEHKNAGTSAINGEVLAIMRTLSKDHGQDWPEKNTELMTKISWFFSLNRDIVEFRAGRYEPRQFAEKLAWDMDRTLHGDVKGPSRQSIDKFAGTLASKEATEDEMAVQRENLKTVEDTVKLTIFSALQEHDSFIDTSFERAKKTFDTILREFDAANLIATSDRFMNRETALKQSAKIQRTRS